MTFAERLEIGAKNLLVNCARLKEGESLLIISERSDLGWYDGKTARFISEVAENMGINPTLIVVGRPENIRCPKLLNQIENHKVTIFFSRIGDQDRFSRPKNGTRNIMCYIRDLEMLASPFATTDYNAFRKLKEAIDEVFQEANDIELTCPLGTRLIGKPNDRKQKTISDVSVHRFPLGVSTPISANTFSGRIAVDRYLTPTGSNVYNPPFVKIKETVFAEINSGRIVGFSGPKEEISKVKEHYNRVATEFKIDPSVVHSWHAGIHPGCEYNVPESDNPDRWSNTIFNNPKYVHFHTCGDYAPGEISCTLPDHTIKVNGITFWNNGCLLPHMFNKTRDAILNFPELGNLFNYSTV